MVRSPGGLIHRILGSTGYAGVRTPFLPFCATREQVCRSSALLLFRKGQRRTKIGKDC